MEILKSKKKNIKVSLEHMDSTASAILKRGGSEHEYDNYFVYLAVKAEVAL